MPHFSKETELSGLVGKPGHVEDCLVNVHAPWCRVRIVPEGGHLLQVLCVMNVSPRLFLHRELQELPLLS